MASDSKAYLGNVKVVVKTPDLTFYGREHLREFKRVMRIAHEQGIEEGRNILESVIREEGIFDTGNLLESVASRLFVRTTDIFEGTVHFNKPGKEYAYFVEHGRGAGENPPYGKIRAWGYRKGLKPRHIYNIWKKIGRVGTVPQPFFDKAEARIGRNYNKIVDKAVKQFRKRKI